MVIHRIGGRVLTIEVGTHANMGDMDMHYTAVFGKEVAREPVVHY